MKAIKLAWRTIPLLTLALLIGGGWVTAGDVAYNYREKTVLFYAMPSDDLPTKQDIAQYCPPGWTYEVYRWVLQDEGGYGVADADQGTCPNIPEPENPFDKLPI